MKIAIIGSPNAIESKWLEKAGNKKGHQVIRLSSKDFSFKLVESKFEVCCEHKLDNFDIFLVRGIYRSYFVNDIYFNKATESLLLLRYIKDILQKPIVDERLASRPIIMSKMATALDLSKANLPQPTTYQFRDKNKILENLEQFSYPVIIKNPAGRKGKNIFKIGTKKDLEVFMRGMPETMPFLFQQYLPTDGDIRILVIGYKALGAMKRLIIPGDFRANISQGAKAENYPLNEEIIKLSQEAAKITETEFAGVDIIKSNGKYYIIEVNRSPQFKGFRKYTKIDPSPYIINYLEKKVAETKTQR